MGLGSMLFGKKKNEKQHPLFPKLPLGIKLNGLVEFKPSCQSYFLLNEAKSPVRVPELDKCVINAISHFKLFDIDILRMYLDSKNPETIIQLHCDPMDNGEFEVRDVIMFNKTHSIFMDTREAKSEWESMIGFKDIGTPDGYEYTREWMADLTEYGESVRPITFDEQYFTEPTDYIPVQNRAMLYARTLLDGTPDDIEYLLVGFRTGITRERVEIWVGTVIDSGYLNII